ncbi:hypothetical protein CC86DRAFT_412454 [Ophiobolus disseminans]|uniref:F-box domain-containing protein n=1 Tax=Ophiobolus disseminans TaxID=1469910 RepID=A0A6A6ZI40_9PLEO|nr:hypothetical protein CC86DRAFT_412454 [Ophiobolus disseminans]
MSLANLSTELDENIIKYLHCDQSALSAMSRLSKYYRTLAQPVLYRDIKFTLATGTKLKQLLMTLFDQRELTKCIRSITILNTCSDDQISLNQAACLNRFSTYENIVKKLLDNASSSSVFEYFAFTLSCSMFRQIPNTMDGALALVLIMASNLEALHIAVAKADDRNLVNRALGMHWNAQDVTRPSCPFQKLSELSIEQKNDSPRAMRVITRPTMRTLRLAGGEIRSNSFPSPLPRTLSALELVGVYVKPDTLLQLLLSGNFESLRRVTINRILDYRQNTPEPEWSLWHYSWSNGYSAPFYLLQTLANCAPNLEVFEFYHDVQQHKRWPSSFPSFKNFSRLNTLRLDINRLVNADDMNANQAIGPKKLLPKTLRCLYITRIPYSRINKYYEHLDDLIQVTCAMDLIIEIARSLPLDNLCLGVGAIRDIGHPPGVPIDACLTSEVSSFLNEIIDSDANLCRNIRIRAESDAAADA